MHPFHHVSSLCSPNLQQTHISTNIYSIKVGELRGVRKLIEDVKQKTCPRDPQSTQYVD